ncbi:hypothetical protein ACRN89_06955 [Streptococcus mitis]|uniref:hypothetical protein n=1 Tax=Streptococcus mitis TaxID=28037 RepID=UPI003D7E2095
MRKSIVLAAGNAYLVQLETTIKSILCHNTEVDFYILNRDIAPEWFKLSGKKMKVVNSTIHNVHYANVTLYQNIIHNRIEWLLDDTTVYLDINHGAEVLDVLFKARYRGIKIFTFDNTRKSSDDSIYDGIFSVESPAEMVGILRKLEV